MRRRIVNKSNHGISSDVKYLLHLDSTIEDFSNYKNRVESLGRVEYVSGRFGNGIRLQSNNYGIKLSNEIILDLLSEDYTFEFWMYVNNTSDSDERADFLLYSDTFVLPNAKYDTLGYLRMNAYYASGLKIRILANKTYDQRKGLWDINETYNAGTTSYQQWVHIAIERYKEELSIYVGGKRIGVVPQYTFSFPGYTETVRSIIGVDTYNLSATGNYIDEIRMSKGACYKGLDFNPPTAPF